MNLKYCQYIILFLSFSCVCLAATNEREIIEYRAQTLKKAVTGKSGEFGVYVYSRTVERYKNNIETFVARCSMLGINTVYLKYKSKPSYEKIMSPFIRALKSAHIRVLAETIDDPAVYIKKDYARKSIEAVLHYQARASDNEKFDGIAVDIEPHVMKRGRDYFPSDYPWSWNSERNYGKGRDNDMLMLETLALLKKIKTQINDFPLYEAIGHFFHHYAAKGDLSKGTVNDFLECTDAVIIMAYSNKPERVYANIADEIVASVKEKSIVICVKTSTGTFGDEGRDPTTTFYFTGWDRFVSAIAYVYEKAKVYPAFRGISFFEFDGLEKMLVEGSW